MIAYSLGKYKYKYMLYDVTKFNKFRAIIPKSWTSEKKGHLGTFVTEEEAWAAIAEYKAEHVGS